MAKRQVTQRQGNLTETVRSRAKAARGGRAVRRTRAKAGWQARQRLKLYRRILRRENDSQRHNLGLIVENATDELYAELSNATFFRPQPKRSFILTYDMRFK